MCGAFKYILIYPPREQAGSLHVELGEAFPHQSGGPQPADGSVHLHSSMRQFLMQEVANEVEEGGRERGDRSSTEVFPLRFPGDYIRKRN